MSAGARQLQAFVELRSEDAEAESALQVARTRLAAGARLRGLRRVRLFELTGVLPARRAAEELLHRSTRFYNPVKERCTVRESGSGSAPFQPEEALVLVLDRGLERRSAAERWWKHETGEKVEVREGLVWALTFEPGTDAAAESASLASVTDRAHGLLSNPHFQDWRPGSGAAPPWAWFEGAKRTPARRRT
jgi:hypothetical protein